MSRDEGTVLRATDAFGRTAPLVFSATWPFAGVRLHVRSNAETALGLAGLVFSPWSSLDPGLVRSHPEAHLDIIVHGDAVDPLPTRLDYRRHGSVFIAAGAGLQAAVHLDTGHAVVFVTPSALAAPDWFYDGIHAR